MSWIVSVSPFDPESTNESLSALASAVVDWVDEDEVDAKLTDTSPLLLPDGPLASHPMRAIVNATTSDKGTSRDFKISGRIMGGSADFTRMLRFERGLHRAVGTRGRMEPGGYELESLCLPATGDKVRSGLLGYRPDSQDGYDFSVSRRKMVVWEMQAGVATTLELCRCVIRFTGVCHNGSR